MVGLKAKAFPFIGASSDGACRWNEPVKRELDKARELNIPVLTPMIGEPVIIGGNYASNYWWEL